MQWRALESMKGWPLHIHTRTRRSANPGCHARPVPNRPWQGGGGASSALVCCSPSPSPQWLASRWTFSTTRVRGYSNLIRWMVDGQCVELCSPSTAVASQLDDTSYNSVACLPSNCVILHLCWAPVALQLWPSSDSGCLQPTRCRRDGAARPPRGFCRRWLQPLDARG